MGGRIAKDHPATEQIDDHLELGWAPGGSLLEGRHPVRRQARVAKAPADRLVTDHQEGAMNVAPHRLTVIAPPPSEDTVGVGLRFRAGEVGLDHLFSLSSHASLGRTGEEPNGHFGLHNRCGSVREWQRKTV